MSRNRPRNRANRNNGSNGDAQAQYLRASAPNRGPALPVGAQYRPIQNLPASVTTPNGSQWAGLNDRPISDYDTNATSSTVPPTQDNVTFPPGDPLRSVAGYNIRQWLYPVGGNITPTPRATEMTSFETLRNLAKAYDVIGMCERAYFRIIERLQLTMTLRPDLLEAGEDLTADKYTRPARLMEDWWNEGPDKRGGDLTSWMIAVMRDLLQIDAVGIINRPARDGRLYSLDLINADTIKLLHDVEGRPALPPSPAYQQIAYGAPGAMFTIPSGRMDGTELDYLKMVNRSESLYGEPPVERLQLIINLALRWQHYQLTRYTDGATPEGVVQTNQPELFKMTVDQVREWEDMWNAALAGNDAMRHRTKFVPPGFSFTSTEQAAIATEVDEWCLTKVVSGYNLTKDVLGITDTSNRSVGESQATVTYQQAVMPFSNYLARYITKVNRRYDGTPLSVVGKSISLPATPTRESGKWDSRFVATWTGIEEPEDFSAKANTLAALVGAGVLGRTEVKRLLNLPVAKGELEIPPMILAPAGADSMVILEDLVKQRDQINDAHKAALDSKIAGAKAAQEQFENGGNPVMAAGMAVGNLNAGAKQQVAAGGSSGGQHTQQQQSPAQAQQTPNPRQNTGGQGRQLAQRAEAPEEERGNDFEDDDSTPAQWRARQSDIRSGTRGKRDVGGAAGDAMGRSGPTPNASNPRDARGTALRAGEQDRDSDRRRHPSGTRMDGGDGAGGERGGLSHPATAGLRSDGDAAGVGVRSSAARGDASGDGGGVAIRGRQSAAESVSAVQAEARREGGTKASAEEVSDEWARYRERALKDSKRGKSPRAFVSDVLPVALHSWVAQRLSSADTPDAVRAVFAEAKQREERITSAASQQTGAMIALMLAPEVARALALPGGEPPSDMHITLAYLGEAADWTPAQRGRLSACLARFASTHILPAGESGPVGQFPVGEENKYPIYVSVNIPGLQAFRAQLVADLARDGLPYDTTHTTYVPHITLAYLDADLDAGARPPINSVPLVPLRFDAITLAMAGARTTFPLQGQGRADAPDTPSAQYDPLAALAQALVTRLEATALSEQRSTLSDLRAQVSQAIRY